jgi:hypothetical protein
MGKNILSSAASLVGILAVGLGIWSQWGNDKANRYSDEAKAAIESGAQFVNQGVEKIKKLYTEDKLASFPANRAELEPLARETVDVYEKAAEQFRLASAKYDEASKQPADAVVVEYFTLWSRQRAAWVERCLVERDFALLILDKDVDTRAKLDARAEEILKRREQHATAVEELSAKADQLQKDNPGKFE